MNTFVEIVSNYLNKENAIQDISSDKIDDILLEARSHQLMCLAYNYLQNMDPLEFDALACLKNYKLPVYHQMLTCKSRLSYAKKIFVVLNATNIKYVMLKGLMFKVLYPNPDVRLMSDLDILVHPDDLERAINILTELGYSIDESREHECNLYLSHPKGIAIELHHKMFSNSVFGDNKFLESIIFENRNQIRYENTKIWIPCHENALSYAILHMAKHFAVTGFGIRQLLDVTLYIDKFKEECDFKKIKKILDAYDVSLFASYLLEICNRIFNRDFALFSNDIEEEKLNFTFNYIMKSGVFGHKNLENDIESEYLYKLQKRNGELKKPFAAKLKFILPMNKRLGERYSYARRHNILLPVAWIHRISYNILHPNQKTRRMLKETPDSKVLHERLEILQHFNLQKKFK